ncbi:hypothetical protein V7S43_007065 [Phytophthora oleae]|uniref:Uncharacterized protein n=1 Tax=Phytophthora oleae TaxID=2107226 RepID=A0ABD3FPH6_9STRA
MLSGASKVAAVLAMLVSLEFGEIHAHGHVRGGSSMALVLSVSTQEEVVNDSCSVSNSRRCQRHLMEAPPEFVPTHEWQDILPNQAIPPGLYIRVNLETGKKEAKLLD